MCLNSVVDLENYFLWRLRLIGIQRKYTYEKYSSTTFPLFFENSNKIKYLVIAKHDNHGSIIFLGQVLFQMLRIVYKDILKPLCNISLQFTTVNAFS